MNTAPSWGLVVIRIVVGFLLLLTGWRNATDGSGESFVAGTREAWAAGPSIVRSFGENVVLEHPWFFGTTLVVGQILCGLALFLGFLTRPAGFLGAALFTFGLFAVPDAQKPLCLLLAVCCFACGLSRAGRRSGADVFLDERLPAWLTWTGGARDDDD